MTSVSDTLPISDPLGILTPFPSQVSYTSTSQITAGLRDSLLTLDPDRTGRSPRQGSGQAQQLAAPSPSTPVFREVLAAAVGAAPSERLPRVPSVRRALPGVSVAFLLGLMDGVGWWWQSGLTAAAPCCPIWLFCLLAGELYTVPRC